MDPNFFRLQNVACLLVAVFGLMFVSCPFGRPPTVPPIACIDLLIHDGTLTTEPEQAADLDEGVPSGTDIAFSWEAGWTKRPSDAPKPERFSEQDDVIETLTVFDDQGNIVGTKDRTVNHMPTPHESRTVDLSFILEDGGLRLQPGTYTFEVIANMDEEDCLGCQCDIEGEGQESIEFELTCPCNDVAISQDLRITGLTTDPPGPIAKGDDFSVVWKIRYAGAACEDGQTVKSGAFTERITVVKLNGDAPPIREETRDVESLQLGSPSLERRFAFPTAPPLQVGTYRVTVELDPDGSVVECNDVEGNNTDDFEFEIVQ